MKVSKVMVNEIEEMVRQLALIQSLRFKNVLFFDNAAPYRETVTTDKFTHHIEPIFI